MYRIYVENKKAPILEKNYFKVKLCDSQTPGSKFTKPLRQICKIFCNFGPQNLEIILTKSSF